MMTDLAMPSANPWFGIRLLPGVLSLAAGSMDVIGFLGLGGLFTAHITGNLVSVAAGPGIDPNAAIATVAGMLAVSAMAVQNALVQVSLHGVPATAVITTNIARFTADVGTILLGARRDEVAAARERAGRLWPSIAGFIIGSCVGAVCEARFGLRALALPAGLALLALAMAAKPNALMVQRSEGAGPGHRASPLRRMIGSL